ncbi:hypothetical protein WA026_004492 [Henosepilachna vigintioctopunctata]|uniref:Uncharacterized protein n=1 Tax=Henosepilachna vigintioctopunctata TaxID=420089 RepID=A0AAW1V720_9CUCU
MVHDMNTVNENDARPGADAQATLPTARETRQSPKISQVMLQRNSASPSVPRKIMSKNHNNTRKPMVPYKANQKFDIGLARVHGPYKEHVQTMNI